MTTSRFRDRLPLIGILAGSLLAAGLGAAVAQNVPNYSSQGGNSWVVGSGGTLTIKSGGTLTADGGSTINGLAASNSIANGQTISVASGGTIALASGAAFTADLCMDSVTFPINSATTDLAPIMVANRAWKVEAIRSVVATAAGGALTGVVKKVAAGTASSAGTDLTTGTIDLNAASTTPVLGTLVATAGVTSIAATDRLVFDLSSTIANTIGVVTVCLGPQ